MTVDIPIYQVDAFASEAFTGNPAAVCPLQEWLPDVLLQNIAAENNLAETAFFVEQSSGYHLRWFTPTVEVDLCGHATLASGFVICTYLHPEKDGARFETRSGLLEVTRNGDLFSLDFPALRGQAFADLESLSAALGASPSEAFVAQDIMAIFESEAEVQRLSPDMEKLKAFETRGVIVTARGESCDFVSRFFAPGAGIPEDPVTGSAHCMMTPYWAERLNKTKMTARQISKRGGELWVEDRGTRVSISGRAVPYLTGTIRV